MKNFFLQNGTFMFSRVSALSNYRYFQKLNVSGKYYLLYFRRVWSESEWKNLVENAEKSEAVIFLILLPLKIFCP